jgi:hypothetical protein
LSELRTVIGLDIKAVKNGDGEAVGKGIVGP